MALGIPASYAALLGMFPEQVARELAYTGRILTAEEALALGAVREVVADPVGRGVALGIEMARHGRNVLEATKRIIIETARGGAAARAWEAELRLFRQALFAGR
ncbi:MAG: hypothetical protein E6J70_02205 [Deltaproteobacteria bacterium]|nr:MAG: hypothetical protein E6J70_02205 [Deltaproteobacteria bacterium]